MPPQTNITEKRIRMSMMLFMHINVRAGFAPAQLARTSLSPALLALALFTTTTTAITLLDNLLVPALFAPASLAPALTLTPISLQKIYIPMLVGMLTKRASFPYSCLAPKKLCRIFGSIFPKFSRMAITIRFFSSNGTSLTPVSLPKNYVAFSEAFSPNSLAWQPPSTFSRLMILPLILASFPKNYVAPSELAASLFCKIFIYQHLIKVYISAFGKSAGILQTPVI